MQGEDVNADLPAAEPAAALPPSRGRFLGRDRAYWRIVVRGAALLLLTLGIYRFWLLTDIRRFLWGNSELAGDCLEYSGTARELLLGFLVAVVLLVPLNAAIFVLAFSYGFIGAFSGVIGFALFTVIGHFAVYRARRYRLTRTIYRGLRFHQTGSAWRYAVCAVFWWVMMALSLGLAYPFAQASLERFKMQNTFYGDLPAHFAASGLSLFLRGLLMWVIVMGPLFVGLVVVAFSIEWMAIADAIAVGGENVMDRIESASPNFGFAIAALVFVLGWAILAAAALYPLFQAMVLRWWIGGLRFGKVMVSSRLRTGQVYGVYLRFLWYTVLFGLGAAVLALVLFLVAYGLGGVVSDQATAEIVNLVIGIGGYVIIALAYSTIYQATVRLRLWRLAFDSIELSDVGVLGRVRARGDPSSAIGEGLADALSVGGI